MVFKKIDHDSDYEDLFGVVSERGVAIEALEDWLAQEFWNFNLGRNQFDGHSEGHCLLAGIDPERSQRTKDQYGPVFLPNSRASYGFDSVTSENEWDVKEAIDDYIDDLKSLGLKGRVHCHDALSLCAKYQLDPPWLGAANDDFGCAKRLPARLRTNGDIIRRINRDASSKGGRQRAKKNEKTKLLQSIGLQEFERLKEQKFPGCLKKSKNDPFATKIADLIYHHLSEHVGDHHEALPELTTVQRAVRTWLKNSPK